MKLKTRFHRCAGAGSALALALAVLAAAGCGSGGAHAPPPASPPPPPGVSALRALSISSGELTPAFCAGVSNYGATFWAEPGDFAVTAAAADPAARLTLSVFGRDPEPMAQGAPAPVKLNEGYTHIRIIAEAQDGSTSATSLTVDWLRPNTKVWVLDGIGGAAVPGATVALREHGGGLLQAGIPVPAGKQGAAVFFADPAKRYDVYAKGPGTAEACFARFDPSREDTATLLCLPGPSGPEGPPRAPRLMDVAFSAAWDAGADSAAWVRPIDGALEGRLSDFQSMMLTLISKAPFDIGRDYAVAFDYDTAANSTFGLGGKAWIEPPLAANAPYRHTDGEDYYMLKVRCLTPHYQAAAGGGVSGPGYVAGQSHWLSIVANDTLHNRVEQRVYFRFADADSAAADAAADEDISGPGSRPTTDYLFSLTYGVSLHQPILDSAPGHGATYGNHLCVWAVKIHRGFEVQRSEDGERWRTIDTVHYPGPRWHYPANGYGPVRGTDTSYIQYTDAGPGLAPNRKYWYRLRCFNANPDPAKRCTQWTNVKVTALLPAQATELAAPAHGAVSDVTAPLFRYRVVSADIAGLRDPERASEYHFSLVVKDLATGLPAIGVSFAADIRPEMFDEEGGLLFYYYDYQRDSWWPAADSGGDGGGNETAVPFAWMDDGGAVSIDTGSPGFQYAARSNPSRGSEYRLLPGHAYEWNIFGETDPFFATGGLPRYLDNVTASFSNRLPQPASGVGWTTWQASHSFGNDIWTDNGAVNGWFGLTIDGNARYSKFPLN